MIVAMVIAMLVMMVFAQHRDCLEASEYQGVGSGVLILIGDADRGIAWATHQQGYIYFAMVSRL